jgi:CheY-like chemotaxis protein
MESTAPTDTLDRPQGILVVDDDDRVLKFLYKMLYSLGHDEVYQAASAKEALQLWNTRASKIWLVISDFVMPGMTGDLMVLQMLKERPSLKAFFISGNDPDSLNSRIPLRAGRNFLQKPFTILDLKKSIQNLASPTWQA